MKKLILSALILGFIGLIDVFYICVNDNEISSSITLNKKVKENIVKKVNNNENASEEKQTNKTKKDKDDCNLYSYEVPKANSKYIKEESVSLEENNKVEKEEAEELIVEEKDALDEENNQEITLEEQIDDTSDCDEILEEDEEEITEAKNENIEVEQETKEEKTDDKDNKKEESLSNESKPSVLSDTTSLENGVDNNLKNGFYDEDGSTYYYENNVKVTGLKNIDGVNHYFSPSGKYLGTNNVKVIDVSYYQGDINWDLFASESDCYGVILRLGYYDTLDKKFERNINEIKRLNIPYGIYLFSYSTTLTGAKKEATFTNNMIDKYDLNPTLGIYYDIESWSSSNGSSSNEITKDKYDNIVKTYVDEVSNHINNLYKVKVYSGRWYAMNRLGNLSKSYVDWVAEYNSTCKYDAAYSMWQYTSKGSVPGINGNVDISYIL